MKIFVNFRLLDLIVVLMVVGFIGLLIPPAVGNFRTRARRNQCVNNLRNIGGSIYAYYDVHKAFPPASVQPNRDNRWVFQGRNRYFVIVSHENWMILLLPHLNRAKLYNLFDRNLPSSDPKNQIARMARLPEACCPDDKYNRENNYYLGRFLDGSEASYARGNYAINVGVSSNHPPPQSATEPNPSRLEVEFDGAKRIAWGDGVAGYNRSFSIKDFFNNLSTTVGVEEVRAGLIPEDGRGIWAMGVVGASITYEHGLYGDACGPNNRNPRSDDSLGCKQVSDKIGPAELVKRAMGCCDYVEVSQATARSMHPGGVNVLMMDQSTRFVVDGVDSNLWHQIHSRETREKIDLANLEVNYEPAVLPQDQLSPKTTWLSDNNNEPAAPKPEEALENSLGSRFMLILPGKFIMDLPDHQKSAPEEVPAHEVEISKAFYMGVHEITQEEYAKVVGKNPSWYAKEGGGAKEIENLDTRRFPVEQVTWDEASEFCRKLSSLPEEAGAYRRYRLPTEAEWEYCCRCGSAIPASVKDSRLPIPPNSPAFFPVDKYPPNSWGLCGMEDGVWEWCSDWYGADYRLHSPRVDPQGPPTGIMHMPRTTAWMFHGQKCVIRFHQMETWRNSRFIGFRIVCDVNNSVKKEK